MPSSMPDRERFLCDKHSSRPTRPPDCPACALEKRLSLLERRLAKLEAENEALRAAVTALFAALSSADSPESAATSGQSGGRTTAKKTNYGPH